MVKQYAKRPLRRLAKSFPRDERNSSKLKECRVIKPAKRNRVVTPSYDAFCVMAVFRENPNVPPEKHVIPRVPLPITLVVADTPPYAVASAKVRKRFHVVSPLAYKPVYEVAGNRDQVGIKCVDALYNALEARTARRCGAMKIAEVDDAVAVKRLRKVIVLYFDAINVGSPHTLVYSPRGKSGGTNGERGKYAARRPHRNAYLRKSKQIAKDTKRKHRRCEHHGGCI